MSDKTAPAKAAAPAPDDPVDAYLTRRLRAAEQEALEANIRLRQMRIELARATAIARRFEQMVRDGQDNTKESDNGSR